MNDYAFGNKILELRTQLGLSQTELARMLGVTNKAVSKWETGKAKPTTNVIRKLAALFKVDVNELLSMRDEERKMEISKIVITGGPCAGKSTAMSWVQNAFTQMGYTVLFVPETATELITGGVAPWTCGTNAEYQKCQLKLQIEKENIFEQAARTMAVDKILIVCDRGVLDNKAYMDDIEFAEAIQFIGSN
jgi:transcriptional regulator with XRE-family HTH domain